MSRARPEPGPARDPGLQVFLGRSLGRLLRAGVALAAGVTAAATCLFVARGAGAAPDDRTFHGQAPELRTVGGVLAGALRLDARAAMQLGLLLLVATPVARVAFSAVAFARQRDRLYVVVTLSVLALLALGLSPP